MNDDEIIILRKAINTFGGNNQIIKTIEELGELETALARYFDRNKADNDNICEEIADVEIMLEQLKMIFDSKTIKRYKEIKLNRLSGVVW